jgi:PilZ domain
VTSDPASSRRLHHREPIPACRPIAVRRLTDDENIVSAWLPADILDLSLGGVCLLIPDDGSPPLEPEARLDLDCHAQPGFGVDHIPCRLIWQVRSGFGVTLGLRFEQPLAALPPLLD